jgi:hypothetical protein
LRISKCRILIVVLLNKKNDCQTHEELKVLVSGFDKQTIIIMQSSGHRLLVSMLRLVAGWGPTLAAPGVLASWLPLPAATAGAGVASAERTSGPTWIRGRRLHSISGVALGAASRLMS